MWYPRSASRTDGPQYLLDLNYFSNSYPECYLCNGPGQIALSPFRTKGRLFYTTLLFHSLFLAFLTGTELNINLAWRKGERERERCFRHMCEDATKRLL